MPKDRRENVARVQRRHNPLSQEIEERSSVKASSRTKGTTRESKREKDEKFVPVKLSNKILQQARAQREEEENESEENETKQKTQLKDEDSDFSDISDEEEEEIEEEYFEIDENDQRALSMFMLDKPRERKCLADIVMEKIREHEEMMNQPEPSKGASSINAPTPRRLDPKVVKVYTGVGRILQNYTSGKVPKAFKIIPSLNNWEEVTYLTSPQTWSYSTFYVATKTFASNMNSKMAQRFYSIILLPKIIDDISENKKLNYHLYRSLKKAVYKPAAFYKGLILPMCEQNVSLIHAHIVGSVLAKVSIPALQSSAALLKLSQMRFSGATCVFIRIILNKKYALPYRVIDAMIVHFTNFVNERRALPVLWHQSLLVFVQRYKEDLTAEHKEGLKLLLRKQFHPQITEEIRRELFNSPNRGENSISITNSALEELMKDIESD